MHLKMKELDEKGLGHFGMIHKRVNAFYFTIEDKTETTIGSKPLNTVVKFVNPVMHPYLIHVIKIF